MHAFMKGMHASAIDCYGYGIIYLYSSIMGDFYPDFGIYTTPNNALHAYLYTDEYIGIAYKIMQTFCRVF